MNHQLNTDSSLPVRASIESREARQLWSGRLLTSESSISYSAGQNLTANGILIFEKRIRGVMGLAMVSGGP